jgi:hypothetical protein
VYRNNSPPEDYNNLNQLILQITTHTEGIERDIQKNAGFFQPTPTRLSNIPDLPPTDLDPQQNSSIENSEKPNSEELNSQLKGIAVEVGKGIYNTGKKTGKALSEINQKYAVTDRLKYAAVSAKNKINQVNEDYHITQKVKTGITTGYNKAKGINQKYHITDKVANGCRTAAEKVGGAISKVLKMPPDNNTTESVSGPPGV